MSDEPRILMARQPFRFEARNYRGKHKRLKSGNIWLAEIEIDRETWDTLDTVPDGAIFEIVGWWSDGDPTGAEKPAAAPAPAGEPEDAFTMGVKQDEDGPALPLPPGEPMPKKDGPWGSFWQAMYAHKFMNNGPLIKHLKVNGMGDSTKIALKKRLNVTSLTDCSPDHLTAWLVQKIREGAELQGALEIAEKVVEKLGGTAYKWGKKKHREDAA